MILLLDNFDSFTYNLQDYLAQVGVDCMVFRNDSTVEEISRYNYKAILLSPGPGKPKDAGCLMDVLNHYAETHPILGICLGHQAIGEYYGAKLTRANKPMHGKISKIFHSGGILFKGVKDQLKVVRYHSLVLSAIPEELEITAATEDNEIMAVSHKRLPVHGLQFHPEAVLTEDGIQMLHNWVRYYKIAN